MIIEEEVGALVLADHDVSGWQQYAGTAATMLPGAVSFAADAPAGGGTGEVGFLGLGSFAAKRKVGASSPTQPSFWSRLGEGFANVLPSAVTAFSSAYTERYRAKTAARYAGGAGMEALKAPPWWAAPVSNFQGPVSLPPGGGGGGGFSPQGGEGGTNGLLLIGGAVVVALLLRK